MNRRNHLINAVLLSIGIGVLTAPTLSDGWMVAHRVLALGVPVVLGALVPDIDVTFGKHRKTLHNLPVLVGFAAFPMVFGNLYFVWVGVAAHYLLDLVGTSRGLALFYPMSGREYGMPFDPAPTAGSAVVLTLLVSIAEVALVVAWLTSPWA